MRIDLLMNKLCLVKTRTIAKKACDKGLVLLNGKTAKSSTKVCADDFIEYQMYGYKNRIKVIMLPTGNVSKTEAISYYETLQRERMEII